MAEFRIQVTEVVTRIYAIDIEASDLREARRITRGIAGDWRAGTDNYDDRIVRGHGVIDEWENATAVVEE